MVPLQACSVIRFSRLRFVFPSLLSLVHVHKHLSLIPYFISLCFATSTLFPQPLMLREAESVSPALITAIAAFFLIHSVYLSHYLSAADRWLSLGYSWPPHFSQAPSKSRAGLVHVCLAAFIISSVSLPSISSSGSLQCCVACLFRLQREENCCVYWQKRQKHVCLFFCLF